MNILVIDNYDSFTYNLVHLIEKVVDCNVVVKKNDQLEIAKVAAFDKIVLSPGPGLPQEAGLLIPVIEKYYKHKSIFGVCLGLQAIAQFFGGELHNLNKVFHGLSRQVQVVDKDLIFENVPNTFMAGRYHSWVADKQRFPKELQISAVDKEGNIMAIYHKQYDIRAVQFHPESILSEYGEVIMKNWLLA